MFSQSDLKAAAVLDYQCGRFVTSREQKIPVIGMLILSDMFQRNTMRWCWRLHVLNVLDIGHHCRPSLCLCSPSITRAPVPSCWLWKRRTRSRWSAASTCLVSPRQPSLFESWIWTRARSFAQTRNPCDWRRVCRPGPCSPLSLRRTPTATWDKLSSKKLLETLQKPFICASEAELQH